MRPLILFTLLVLISCGEKQKSSYDYGKTTKADLLKEKGEPLAEEDIPLKNAKILLYPNNEKIQVEGEFVTGAFLTPEGDEKTLMYWKHKFKDCSDLSINKVDSPSQSHVGIEMEMRCPEEGKSVIYVDG